MGMLSGLRRFLRGEEPTMVDYDAYVPAEPAQQRATGTDGPVLRRVGPGMVSPTPTSYKIQQSYDSLMQTVQDLRESLDGQAKRQEELLSKLSGLPSTVETLPQTSKMQSDMLKMINERLSMHAEQQRKISEVMTTLGASGKEQGEAIGRIREQIETGNEIDRQLVESFNRFSLMIDRLHAANHQQVECLQQVRDSYAATQMQLHEWVDKSRARSQWLMGAALVMSTVAVVAVVILIFALFHAK